MDLLLCIVDTNAAAKALAAAASQSLHAVDDCSCVVECCAKVLPAALSTLEGAASASEDAGGQAVECVQGCNAAMLQLQAAIEALNAHGNEGVLGILLEHPAAWLDTYRGFRGLTAQLLSISCLVRAAAQRGQADEADEALHESIKSLMATCNRSREAANLIGTELPDFARDAAAEGWSVERLRCPVKGVTAAAAARGGSGAASPCGRSGCRQSACGGGVAPAAVLAAASAALQQQQQNQSLPQTQRMGLLRRIGKAAAAAAGSSPLRRGGGSGSAAAASLDPSFAAVGPAGRLDGAACTLVARIQDLILYDSEVDQLEQDQAYLRQRVAHLVEYCDATGGGSDGDGGASPPLTAGTAAAAAALIQSEILLAAVDSRLRALAEQSDSADAVALDCAGGGAAIAAAAFNAGDVCADVFRGGVDTPRRAPTRSERLVDAEDLYDDVRKRRSALRWLPVCFVGA